MRPGKAILLSLLVANCASSTVESFTDPNFQKALRHRSIVVAAANLPLSERRSAERAMVETAIGLRVNAVEGMQIAPPTRANAPEDVRRAIVESGATALLVMWAVSKESQTRYVPPAVIGQGSAVTQAPSPEWDQSTRTRA